MRKKRHVYFLVTEGITEFDALRIVFSCYLCNQFKDCGSNSLKAPLPPDQVIKYISDISKVVPGIAYLGRPLRYAIAYKKNDVEVLIVPLQAPYTLSSKGYKGVIHTIMRYLTTGILKKKKVSDPVVETDYHLVGVVDVDVFLEKEWKPEHNKHVYKDVHGLICGVLGEADTSIGPKSRHNLHIDVILKSKIIKHAVVPRLVKIGDGYENNAYLLFWGHCKDRYFYEAVEDIEATILDILSNNQNVSIKEEEIKDIIRQLSNILPKKNSMQEKYGSYKACILNSKGIAMLHLISGLQLLAYSLEEKHPITLWNKEENKEKIKLLEIIKKTQSNRFCEELLEKCELNDALDIIFNDVKKDL